MTDHPKLVPGDRVRFLDPGSMNPCCSWGIVEDVFEETINPYRIQVRQGQRTRMVRFVDLIRDDKADDRTLV